MWFYEIDWRLTLEFLKVYASWPPVVGAIAIAFFLIFRDQIGDMLRRVQSAGAGPVSVRLSEQPTVPELSTSFPTTLSEAAQQEAADPSRGGMDQPSQPTSPKGEACEVAEDTEGAKNPDDPKASSADHPAPTEPPQVDQEALEWRYFNRVLVPASQHVLDLLAVELFATVIRIRSVSKIDAIALPSILTALERLRLITFDGHVASLTPKGSAYVLSGERHSHLWLVARQAEVERETRSRFNLGLLSDSPIEPDYPDARAARNASAEAIKSTLAALTRSQPPKSAYWDPAERDAPPTPPAPPPPGRK